MAFILIFVVSKNIPQQRKKSPFLTCVRLVAVRVPVGALLLLHRPHRPRLVLVASLGPVLHHRGELWPLLEQRDLGRLPVEVRDGREALEPHSVLLTGHEVRGRHGERQAEAVGAVKAGRGEVPQVGLVCLKLEKKISQNWPRESCRQTDSQTEVSELDARSYKILDLLRARQNSPF